jgi:hypothetical protein
MTFCASRHPEYIDCQQKQDTVAGSTGETMNIFDMLGGQDQRQVEALARQFGLDEAQTRAALEQLAPVVAAGMRQQAQSAEGLGQLLNALARGTMGSMNATDADQLRSHGNDILSQVFGDKDVSRGVAQQIAEQTGIGASILKQMLPMIAMMEAGSMLKSLFGGRGAPAAPPPSRQADAGAGGGLGDLLNDILTGGANRGQAAPPQPHGAPGGGGLGDILGEILGDGARGGPSGRAPQGGNEIDRLREVLSDLVTGGQQQAPQQRAPERVPQSAPQSEAAPRGDGGIGDILREILGGAPPPQQRQPAPETPREAAPQRSPLDDIFGAPGSSSRSAADELLESVQRRLGRR